MRRLRRIKILATLGPASSDLAMIRRLFEAGADLFRINMSHTPHDKMRELVATIRNVESSYGRPIGILVDLQGPKLRLGAFAEGAVQLQNGQTFTLDSDKTPGDATRVQLPHPEILAALRPGHALLLDDGKVRLIAEETSKEHAVTRVVVGGRMSDRKGVSLPDTDLPVSAMTPKDRADLEAALVTGVDWIALSFVQRADDVIEAKKMIRGRAAVMAKIEKPQAIDRLADIIDASDALMVARGDLGVELPLERVPGLQKQMTRMARRAGKPVVIATQMLESMIQSPVPTRAEVSDVATAVYEGADAIMLSAESAAGKFPVEAVSTMNRIGEEVERDPIYRSVITAQRPAPESTAGDAIADAARQIAETLDLPALICWTSSGSTASRVAREPAEAADRGDHAEHFRWTPARRRLGCALRGGGRRARPGRHGEPRRPDRVSGRLRPRRPARAHRRRRAARHPRHHQHGAHRLGRPRGRSGYLGPPAHGQRKSRKQPHAQ
ncbi:pyruvate kinase [Bradyrhizobium sp. LB9.1b]